MKAEYVDHMGDDLRVVNAARVSFDKESEWDWIDGDHFKLEELKASDAKLISYLAKHGHWTPFSHPQITMRETVPIFVARQRFKHMVGFTYNEVSRRYVDDTPEIFKPDKWRARPENAKQGSSTTTFIHPTTSEILLEEYDEIMEIVVEFYETLINTGVAPEQARMVLPQSMYTSYYVTGSLAAWSRAYKQRIDSHAQKEIQDLAVQWDAILRPLFPVSWKALTDG